MTKEQLQTRLDSILDEEIYAFREGADLEWEAQRQMNQPSSHSLGFVHRYDGGMAGVDAWLTGWEIKDRVTKLDATDPMFCRVWDGKSHQPGFVLDIRPFGNSYALLIGYLSAPSEAKA